MGRMDFDFAQGLPFTGRVRCPDDQRSLHLLPHRGYRDQEQGGGDRRHAHDGQDPSPSTGPLVGLHQLDQIDHLVPAIGAFGEMGLEPRLCEIRKSAVEVGRDLARLRMTLGTRGLRIDHRTAPDMVVAGHTLDETDDSPQGCGNRACYGIESWIPSRSSRAFIVAVIFFNLR